MAFIFYIIGIAFSIMQKTKIAQKYCDEAFSINDTKPCHKNLVYTIIGTRDEEDDV